MSATHASNMQPAPTDSTGHGAVDKQRARTGPDRLLFLQRQRKFDRLVEICTQKLQGNPYNDKALLVRASAYLKSGAFGFFAT